MEGPEFVGFLVVADQRGVQVDGVRHDRRKPSMDAPNGGPGLCPESGEESAEHARGGGATNGIR